jgi:two-component system aerobic respiration control sensor histidine kinase ArcB
MDEKGDVMQFVPKILLVEDEEVTQKSMNALWTRLGCQVDVASTGHGALFMVSKRAYDMVIMDIGIFDLDGFNVTKRIKSMGDQLQSIPIVAVTSYAHNSVRNRATSLGLNDFLIKPLKIDDCKFLLKRFFNYEVPCEELK